MAGPNNNQGNEVGNDFLFLVVGLLGIVALSIVLYFTLLKKDEPKKREKKEESKTDSKPLSRQQRRLRNRKAKKGKSGADETKADVVEENNDDEDDVDSEIDLDDEEVVANLTSKQMRKAIKKREARERREAVESARRAREEQMEARNTLYDEKQRKKEEERMKKQEEIRKRVEEQKKKSEKEFEQWKDLISVEEEGSNAGPAEEETQDKLQRFVHHVSEKKVLMLEELAVTFNLRTQEVINRLESLEKMGRISGVFDDRGKFIYITKDELDQVAQFILKKGRISIAEVAKESNKLIDLNPKNTEEEQKEAQVTLD